MLDRLLRILNLKRIKPCEVLVHVPTKLVGRWTQARDTDTNLVLKYEHTCACEITRKFAPNEINRQINRGCQCGEFNLKQALAVGAVSTKLITREKPQRTVQTIGEAFDGNFRYEPLR